MKIPALMILQDAQRESVANADPLFDVTLNPDAWIGMASDGRPLDTLLDSIPYRSVWALGKGATQRQAVRAGADMAAMLTRTQVADAGRSATQVGMAADLSVRGYVREVSLPACARCIILSNRFYRWSSGFLRHPACDCGMRPVRSGEKGSTEDPDELIRRMREEHPERLKRSLSESDLKALDHGADLNQVVNAHRGMTRAAAYGRTYRATTEGTTRRGYAGSRLIAEAERKGAQATHVKSTHQRITKRGVTTVRVRGARTPRLSPDEIFAAATRNGWGRDEVIRQLGRFGYI